MSSNAALSAARRRRSNPLATGPGPAMNMQSHAAPANRILQTHKKAKLIIANNVLAHVPDIHDFIEGVSLLLADDGVIETETPVTSV